MVHPRNVCESLSGTSGTFGRALIFLSLPPHFSLSSPSGIVERKKVELYSHVPVMRNVLDQLKVSATVGGSPTTTCQPF